MFIETIRVVGKRIMEEVVIIREECRSSGNVKFSQRASLIKELKAVLPGDALITGDKACSAYSSRAMAEAAPNALAVVLAETITHVQAVLQICQRYKVRVVPRGAGTNLSCAVSPSRDTVIVCCSRMRELSDFDPVAGTVRVGAGVRNKAVSDYVEAWGWYYAPDPSSRRNCTIGGNVATNSGGSSCLRSGVTVNHMAGLTMVLFNGSIINLGDESYDASGLGLASLMCGSEGQMGIVTEIVLRLSPCQPARCGMILGFEDRSAALRAGTDMLFSGVALAQMDYMDAFTVRLCEAATSAGYPDSPGGIILIDVKGSEDVVAESKETVTRIAAQHASYAKVFSTDEEVGKIWRGRERIYGAVARISHYVATDVAVPLSVLSKMLEAIDSCADEFGLRYASTVHMGDGTVHSFLLYDDQCSESSKSAEACATAIRKTAIRQGGTATSEYGIGTRHLDILSEQFSVVDLGVQQRCMEAMCGSARSMSGSTA